MTRPHPATDRGTSRDALIERIVRGGFPEALAREDERREEWLASYLTAIVQRDLRDLANIERLAEVPALLASLASRMRAPLNKTGGASPATTRSSAPSSSASSGWSSPSSSPPREREPRSFTYARPPEPRWTS